MIIKRSMDGEEKGHIGLWPAKHTRVKDYIKVGVRLQMSTTRPLRPCLDWLKLVDVRTRVIELKSLID